MMTCRSIALLLDAFADGELPPERIFEVEEHLGTCENCLEHLQFIDAMRRSTQRAVHGAAKASPEFTERLGVVFAAEREREVTQAVRTERMQRLQWGTVAPLAAAAGVVLGVASWLNNRPVTPSPATAVKQDGPVNVTASIEQLIDELVDYHTAPPAPQITEAALAGELAPEVGVPVHAPALTQFGAHWESGSVIPMRSNQRAAFFRYELSNHQVTVYVYNAARVPLRAALEPRVVHNVPVHVGEHRGYSIAARERHGVGYAIATDLGDEESAELVASIQ